MKKLTLTLLFLCCSLIVGAQIEINENFDTVSSNQIPANWTATGFGNTTAQACATASSLANLTAGNSANLNTPTFQSNGTDVSLSFDYNIFTYSFFGGASAPPAGWGDLTMQYTTDGGATYIPLTVVNDANYTYTGPCQNFTTTIPMATLPTGTNFQVQFLGNNTTTSTTFRLFVDNVSINQLANDIPNCNASITNPTDGATLVEIDGDLSWSSATGFADGYRLTVGSTSGGTDIVNDLDVLNTTTYDLPLLTYNTTYFVTIMPYNSFGNATGCVEESFTTRMPPINGAVCNNAIEITSFPYNVSSETSIYDNDYGNGSSPCTGGYMSGSDVFYTLTPTEDVSLNITLSNITNNGAGMHIIENCVDNSPVCVAFTGSYASTDKELTNVLLLEGVTYFIVLSNSSATRDYSYDLEVVQNTCINSTMTATPVADCDNNQFTVDVDITDLGSATSLTIADNFGNENNNVTATGIENFGPYADSSEVIFTVTDNDNGTCVTTENVQFFCPPSNDDCDNAIVLSVNTDETCTLLTAANNVSGTETTGADDSTCAISNYNDVFFTFTATNTSHIFQLLNVTAVTGTSVNMSSELLEGDCGTLTSIDCMSGNYSILTGLTVGTMYSLRVWSSSASSGQQFDVCLSTPPAAPANDVCSDATTFTLSSDNTCDNAVSGTTKGATQSSENSCSGDYNDVWFSFTPTNSGAYNFNLTITDGNTVTYYYVYSGVCGAFNEESTSCTASGDNTLLLDGGTEYSVMVRTNTSGPGVDFDLCVYQLPDPVANSNCSGAIELLESEDINGNNAITSDLVDAYYSEEGCANANSESIWFAITPQFSGTYFFEFERITGTPFYTVYNTNDCATVMENYVPGISSCYNSGAKTTTLVANNTYLVMVHAANAAEFEIFAYPDPAIILYPPANDFCADAETLTISTNETCDNAVSGNTIDATISAENDCSTNFNDAWYVFTATETGYFQFTLNVTSGTDDTFFSLYSGDCGALVQESLDCDNENQMIQLLENGMEYKVLVRSSDAGDGVTFDLCVYALPPAVENNDCATATALLESNDNTGNNTISGSLENAYYSQESCGAIDDETIWYTFTPQYTGMYFVDFTSTSGDATFAMYDTDNCSDTEDNYVSGITACDNNGNVPVTLAEDTTYLLSVKAQDAATFDLFIYPDPSLGTTNTNFEAFSFYPNPVTSVINFNSNYEISTVEIINISGQKVSEEKGENIQSIQLDTLNSGIYFMNVTINSTTQTFKLIKK